MKTIDTDKKYKQNGIKEDINKLNFSCTTQWVENKIIVKMYVVTKKSFKRMVYTEQNIIIRILESLQ